MVNKSESGFTLVEISFVLIIWGGIMALLFSMYTEYRNRMVLIETNERLQLNAEAITAFSSDPKRYPCPSMPGLPESDPNFGREMCAEAAALALGTCDRGLCHVAAARDVDNDPLTIDSVIIGGVPFMDLLDVALANGVKNINAAKRRSTYDGWGGAFTYVVSANLTDETTFDNNHGGISVETEWGDSIVTPNGSADFLLISHGQDMRGAYNQEQIQGVACAGAGRDLTNCEHDDAEFVNSLIYRQAGASYFDDYVYVYQAVIDGIWEQMDDDIFYKGTGNLGLGVANPTERLEVDGRAYGDQLHSDILCDATGADCFSPEALGGVLARDGMDNVIAGSGMGCDDPDNNVATGIENSQFVCGAPGFSPDHGRNVSCGAGSFLSGFNADGSANCVTP